MIYAIFNRQFRQPFWEILRCHCHDINLRLRSKHYQTEYGGGGTYNSMLGGYSDTPNISSRRNTQSLLQTTGEVRRHSLFEEKAT